MTRIPASAGRPSAFNAVVLGLLILALVALLDNLTPVNVNFGLLYLLAVAPVAWLAGQRAGLVMAVLATAIEGVSGIIDRDPVAVGLWNALSRLAVLSLIVVVIDRLHRRQIDLDRIDGERRTLLGLLEREFPRPLKALDWFSRVLDESLERGSVEAAHKQIKPLRFHVREALFLATDLLTVGSLQTGTLTFDRIEVDLRQVVADAADATLDRARILSNMPDGPLLVRCDPDRLAHAISIVFGRCGQAPYASIPVFVRAVADEGLIQVSSFDEIGHLDLELAQLLVVGGGGRLDIVPRSGSRGVVVSIFVPRAITPAAGVAAPAGVTSNIE